MTSAEGAAGRWADELSGWALPADVLAAAPESPWTLDPDAFATMARAALSQPAETPTRLRALAALSVGGTVLDVGAGAGAASLPLAPPAGRIVAVDRDADMLSRFAQLAADRGVEHAEVVGSWPEAACAAGRADVVICAHVLYNVADLPPFAAALTAAARRRVVCEISQRHPQSALAPLWQQFHRLSRPSGPTAEDAVAVLRAAGIAVGVERFTRDRGAGLDRAQAVASVRRRLALPADRDAEIDAALPDPPVLAPRELVTLWWDAAG